MRSTNHADYQGVARPVAAMAKDFADRAETGIHAHPRGQLLHAVSGVMLARTYTAIGEALDGAWLVPPGHALWIPPGTRHNVEMRGAVSMRTVYLSPDETRALSARCRVLLVSNLLREAIIALTAEDILYDEAGRGGHLAALVIDEIARAETAKFDLPLPQDRRFLRICEAMIADPAVDHDLDRWADIAGASRRALTRGFRTETGLSFGAWRRRLRTLNALGRLENGEAVGMAAHKVGYRSPSALTAMIRRELA